jgi:hypothetical protein
MKAAFLTFIYDLASDPTGMDLTSFYLRTFLGARPFGSSELDSLAERMNVLHLLSGNPRDRYFTTSTRAVSAANLGNKVVFSRLFYDSLSEDERLAVGAHEFAHILHCDNRRGAIATSTLGFSLVSAAMTFLVTHSVLLAESFFCLFFLGLMWIRSSRDVEKGRLEELKCDSVAASFVGCSPVVRSIRLADSMRIQRSRPGLFRGSRRGVDPGVEERATAIMGLRRE